MWLCAYHRLQQGNLSSCANIFQLQVIRKRHLSKSIHITLPFYASINESYRRFKDLAEKLKQIINLGLKRPKHPCLSAFIQCAGDAEVQIWKAVNNIKLSFTKYGSDIELYTIHDRQNYDLKCFPPRGPDRYFILYLMMTWIRVQNM